LKHRTVRFEPDGSSEGGCVDVFVDVSGAKSGRMMSAADLERIQSKQPSPEGGALRVGTFS
jgi:hypothetical protein